MAAGPIEAQADRELPLAAAAAAMGMSVEALRMRFRRGKVRGRKDAAGRLLIAVPGQAEQPTERQPDAAQATPGQGVQVELTALLRDQVADLRRRLDASEEAQAEMRRLLMASSQQIAELTKRLVELPPPSPASPAKAKAREIDPEPPASPPTPKPENQAPPNPFAAWSVFWPFR